MTRRLTYAGYTYTIAEWAACMDLTRTALLMRLRRGMDLAEALTLATMDPRTSGRRGAARSTWRTLTRPTVTPRTDA